MAQPDAPSLSSPRPVPPGHVSAGQGGSLALPRERLLRFIAVALPVSAAAQPIIAYVPTIYATDYGIPLATLGLVLLAGKVINSLLDPVVGALSDRTQSRFGRRRPWLAGGGGLFLAGSAMLFFPPTGAGAAWVGIGALLYFCGASITTTVHLAWSGEVSGDYHQRTRIASLFTLFSSAALVLALLLPTIADQWRPDDGALRLTLFGTLVLALGVPGLILTLTAVPDAPALTNPGRFRLRDSLRAVFANRLLLRVLASDVAVTAGQAARTGLLLLVVAFYFQRPEWAAGLFLFQYAFGLLAGPIWHRIGVKLGKARAAVLGELLQTAINGALLFLTPADFGALLFLTFLQGLAQGSGNLMLRAMVADIADQHRAETGEDRTGLYYSVFSVSQKLGGAIALGIALPLVGWLGFDPQSPANTPEALHGLLLVFALGPALGHALSAALVTGFPLDEAAHSEIRRQLEVANAALVPAE